MPKTLTPIQALEQKIKDTEAAIADREHEFLLQQQENNEFSEALKILNSGVADYVQPGRVLILSKINSLLDEASDAEDRKFRLETTQRAIAAGRVASTNLENELQRLRQQLAIAQDELDWQQDYADAAQRYRLAFMLPDPSERKESQIRSLEKDIATKQQQLTRAQAWLQAPQDNKPWYTGVVGMSSAVDDEPVLVSAIATLTASLERLRAEPERVDEEWQAAFRRFIRQRVAVQVPLTKLLESQASYLRAVAEFKEALQINPCACEFSPHAIGQVRIVNNSENGRITLA
ncbi:hypothetical protein [Tolypothrix sp. VBCCA 56010]|uniref:hypothetical protein n=1 Tax=Tolypothrix sp. VBCCA 56010 TaxID=3137731 RepID=UPI003D7F10C8